MQQVPERRSIDYLEELRHSPHVCLAEGLRAANRAVGKIYAAHMAGAEVSPAQSSLLTRLYYLREATMSDLAAHMETDRTTMARNVDLLRRSGHVEIVTGREDRRRKLVRMTDKGFAALEQSLPLWREAQEALRTALGEAMWASLLGETRELARLGGLAHDRRER